MNRMVTLPALCSLIAFGSFYAGRVGSSQHGDTAGAAPVVSIGSIKREKVAADRSPSMAATSAVDAERLIRAVGEQYQARHRSWQEASHSIMSRASPGPRMAPIRLDIVMSPKSAKSESRLASATIMVRRKQTIEMLPCVVDLTTQEVFVFHSDRWMPAQRWVETAGSIFDGVNSQQK